MIQKKWVALVMLCILQRCVCAQEFKRKSPEEKAKKYTSEMVAVCQLEKAEEEKVFLLNVEVSKKFDSLYSDKADKEKLKIGMIKIFRWRDAELRKILSNEQFLRFDDFQREKREQLV